MLHQESYALYRHESCDTSIMDYLMVCRQYHFDNPDTMKELQFVLRFFQRLIKALFMIDSYIFLIFTISKFIFWNILKY